MKKTIAIIAFSVLISLAFSSPGDSVGMTAYDFQRSGSFGQRIAIDANRHVYVYWMHANMYFPGWWAKRMKLNIRDPGGSYHGAVAVCGDSSGFGTIDISRDVDPNMQRLVVCYHREIGYNQYYPFIDVDSGNAMGYFPNHPRYPSSTNNYLWPCVACANNGNIILATDDNTGNFQHLFVTTDKGNTWTNPANFDSVAVISQFVRASNNPGSNKVVFVNTKYLTDSVAAGQLDNDVYYLLSTDGGITWGPRANITCYRPQDTVRAYWGTHANFDLNDNLHIVWAGRHVTTGNYYDASKIFHWDEVHDSITVVSGPNPRFPGGWWAWNNPYGYGAHRMPADEPQLVADRTTGWLYCLWHGQDDTTDYSAAGFSNGDIYGAYSTDGGLIWDAYGTAYGYVNLTNTHTPGAPRWFCEDEDYMTANPFTVDDSIFITYIEDKDAGEVVNSEGDTTDNPVRMWVFHKSLISGPQTVEEAKPEKPLRTELNVCPNPFKSSTTICIEQRAKGIELKIYDITGRAVRVFSYPYALGPMPFAFVWPGDDDQGNPLPAGVYVCRCSDGTRVMTSKIIKL